MLLELCLLQRIAITINFDNYIVKQVNVIPVKGVNIPYGVGCQGKSGVDPKYTRITRIIFDNHSQINLILIKRFVRNVIFLFQNPHQAI